MELVLSHLNKLLVYVCTLTPDLSTRREGYQRRLPLPNSATKWNGTLGYPSQVLPVKDACDERVEGGEKTDSGALSRCAVQDFHDTG
jgi:hypothetical protein